MKTNFYRFIFHKNIWHEKMIYFENTVTSWLQIKTHKTKRYICHDREWYEKTVADIKCRYIVWILWKGWKRLDVMTALSIVQFWMPFWTGTWLFINVFMHITLLIDNDKEAFSYINPLQWVHLMHFLYLYAQK